jgi:Outer membrane protein beta-barrel domain
MYLKKALSVFMLLLSFTFIHAQTDFLTVGARGGVNFAHFWGQPNARQVRFSFNSGLFVRYRLSNTFSLEGGIDYQRMGASFGNTSFTNDAGVVVQTLRLNVRYDYIQVPVLLQFDLSVISAKVSNIKIGIGPVIGGLIYAGSNSIYSPDSLVAQDVKKIDLGLMFTLKPIFKVKQFNFEPEVGYYLGLLQNHNVTRQQNGNFFIRLGIAYRFEEKEN